MGTETERIAGVIEIDTNEVQTTTKNTWKNKAKEKIKIVLEKQSKRNEENSKNCGFDI